MSYPTADDAAIELAILPDWGDGIESRTMWTTLITRSRRGIEQRTRKRATPRLIMTYTPAQLHGLNAFGRLDALRTYSRSVLFVPWWPSGLVISGMASETSLTVASTPMAGEWEEGRVFLWSAAAGGQFRTVASRTASNFTLEAEAGATVYSSGYAFPVRAALLEGGEALLRDPRHSTASGMLTFKTLGATPQPVAAAEIYVGDAPLHVGDAPVLAS